MAHEIPSASGDPRSSDDDTAGGGPEKSNIHHPSESEYSLLFLSGVCGLGENILGQNTDAMMKMKTISLLSATIDSK